MGEAGVTGAGADGKAPFALRHPRLWFWVRAYAAYAAIATAFSLAVTSITTWPIRYFLDDSLIHSSPERYVVYWLPYAAVVTSVPTAIAARFAAETFDEAWWKIAVATGLIFVVPEIPTLWLSWSIDALLDSTSTSRLGALLGLWPLFFTTVGLLAGAFWAKLREADIGEDSKIARLRTLRNAGIRPVEGLYLIRAFIFWSAYNFAAIALIRSVSVLWLYLPGTRQPDVVQSFANSWLYPLIPLFLALILGTFITWRVRINSVKLLVSTAIVGAGLALWAVVNNAFSTHEALQKQLARRIEEGADPSRQIQVGDFPAGIDFFDSDIWLPSLMVLLGGGLVYFIKSEPIQRAIAWLNRPPHYMRGG